MIRMISITEKRVLNYNLNQDNHKAKFSGLKHRASIILKVLTNKNLFVVSTIYKILNQDQIKWAHLS